MKHFLKPRSAKKQHTYNSIRGRVIDDKSVASTVIYMKTKAFVGLEYDELHFSHRRIFLGFSFFNGPEMSTWEPTT